MDQPSPFDKTRLRRIERTARELYDTLEHRVVNHIKALPDTCRQSGDDSGLADVWEEFKYQCQRQESAFFDMYLDTIDGLCAKPISEMDDARATLLWLWSEAFISWDFDCDNRDKPGRSELNDAIRNELFNRVRSRACDEDLLHDPDDLDEARWQQIRDCCPDDWWGKGFVDVANCGDGWLDNTLCEDDLDWIADAEADLTGVASHLAAEYVNKVEPEGFPLLTDFLDRPTTAADFDEQRREFEQEFLAFLNEWRRRVLTVSSDG
jgi:hypothetical protein